MDSEWHTRRDFIGDRYTWYPSCYFMHHRSIKNGPQFLKIRKTNTNVIQLYFRLKIIHNAFQSNKPDYKKQHCEKSIFII